MSKLVLTSLPRRRTLGSGSLAITFLFGALTVLLFSVRSWHREGTFIASFYHTQITTEFDRYGGLNFELAYLDRSRFRAAEILDGPLEHDRGLFSAIIEMGSAVRNWFLSFKSDGVQIQNLRDYSIERYYLGEFVLYERFENVKLHPGTRDRPSERLLRIYVPGLLVFALCLVQPTYWLIIHARVKDGHCLRCGYDLRFSGDRCPECGMLIVPDCNQSNRARNSDWNRALFVGMAALVLALKAMVSVGWLLVVAPIHLDSAWPVAATIATSAPWVFRFVDGPLPEPTSILIYVECIILNSLMWGMLLSSVLKWLKGARSLMGGTKIKGDAKIKGKIKGDADN